MSDALKPLIAKAINNPLNKDEAREAFDILMSGTADPAQIGGLLMILRMRGESVNEITAAVEVMRARMNKVTPIKGAMDIVGTGGDGTGTLNISTATAIIVAGADVVVAKHGNRNLSSKSGAADVLTQSGVNIMLEADQINKVLEKAGIAFMMAPLHHPAIKHVMPARMALAQRTIFNILGPMTNPASVEYQLTGAYSKELLRPMAETLQALGTKRAWLVHGGDGTDEVSITAPTSVVETDNGTIKEFSITPQDAGLEYAELDEILGGEPSYNAARFTQLLDGARDAYRDAVLFNAAAAFLIIGKVDDLRSGVALAEKTIDEGHAKAKLQMLVEASNG